MAFQANSLVPGMASGELLFSHIGLSFWGGVDQYTGKVIDNSHPLCGEHLAGRILAIPSGRGSCSGSVVLLELILNGHAPAGLIFQQPEDILALGVLVAKAMFNLSLPAVVLSPDDYSALEGKRYVQINDGSVLVSESGLFDFQVEPETAVLSQPIQLSSKDEEMLAGKHGPSKKIALEVMLDFALIQGAERLLDVTQVHIDACIYTGSGGLQFAQNLVSMGGKFSVPTTLNSISVDRRRWRELGVIEEVGQPADDLAKAYLDMGAQVSFTCAPYLLDSAPGFGEQVGWAESNAVVFANSVLGARSQKYPDLLDVCIALTGRAPFSGCHRDEDRLPTILITLPRLSGIDDSLYPVLGYHIGKIAGPHVPLICGLERACPRITDLKAFGAAFATTSSLPIFHMKGVTPEADRPENTQSIQRQLDISYEELCDTYRCLTTARDRSVDLVSLGNPHFTVEEFADLAHYCSLGRKHPKVLVVVTTSRAVVEKAEEEGHLEGLADWGVDIMTDTCWCMIDEPVIPASARNLMTNSAKYAHYGPGMVQRGVHFGSLEQCIKAACKGEHEAALPSWLSAGGKQ